MAAGGNTKKGMSHIPKGAEHQPDAIRARKQRRHRAAMDALSPKRTGSAAYQRRTERRS